MAPFNKKLATAFSRRKSASNALDDNTSISPSTTASSQGFRVLERAEVDNRRNGGRPVIPLGNQSDLRLR